MDVAVAVDTVGRVGSLDPVTADLAGLQAGLAQIGRLRRWLDGREVQLTNGLRALAEVSPSLFPEPAIAEATGTSLRHGMQVTDRAKTTDAVPAFADALAQGRVSGEHVDALTAGLRSLEPAERPALINEGERLARLAEMMTADDLRREVATTTRRIRTNGGMTRLERQKRDVRVRTWTDGQSGMIHLNGRFDPETGAELIGKLTNRVDQLFHDSTPALCPSDPLEKQDFLRAHALLSLVHINPDGTTPVVSSETSTDIPAETTPGPCGCAWAGETRADIVLTFDHTTLIDGYHPNTRIDTGVPGLELPLDTIRRMVMFADITPALLDDNGVVLKLGRTTRLANRAQRRALRGMYRHCAIPGCRVPVSRTQPHHTQEWDADHGPTDIEHLVPICKHHHDLIHKHHWKLSLSPDRRLTITYPDGTTMTTGPPHEQWA